MKVNINLVTDMSDHPVGVFTDKEFREWLDVHEYVNKQRMICSKDGFTQAIVYYKEIEVDTESEYNRGWFHGMGDLPYDPEDKYGF